MTADVVEIRVRGEVPDSVRRQYAALHWSPVPPTTVLRGRLADAAALHGIVVRLHSLGLRVVEVRRTAASTARDHPAPARARRLRPAPAGAGGRP